MALRLPDVSAEQMSFTCKEHVQLVGTVRNLSHFHMFFIVLFFVILDT